MKITANCNYCNKSQINEMQFIAGYCWNCLIKAQKSSNLPIELLVEMLKEKMVIS